MKYIVSGMMKIKKEWKPFEKEVEGASKNIVKEKVLAIIGSDHKLARTQVKITSIEAVKT
jgi:ribosomal protein L20A (L18A)